MATKKTKQSRPRKVTLTGHVFGPEDECIGGLEIRVVADGVGQPPVKTHRDGCFKVSVHSGARVCLGFPAATPDGLVLPCAEIVECQPTVDEPIPPVSAMVIIGRGRSASSGIRTRQRPR